MREATTSDQRIAILGWGSLLWDGGADCDRYHDEWRADGPSLPIEFSRISSTRLGALTLVVDAQNGQLNGVAWCLSRRKRVEDAVADVRCREGCLLQDIGRSDIQIGRYEEGEVRGWAEKQKLDVVVWTALEGNFRAKTSEEFTVDRAVAYLQELPPVAKVKAAEYMWRAPAFVQTPLRAAMQTRAWFRGTPDVISRVDA